MGMGISQIMIRLFLYRIRSRSLSNGVFFQSEESFCSKFGAFHWYVDQFETRDLWCYLYSEVLHKAKITRWFKKRVFLVFLEMGSCRRGLKC